MITMWIGFWLFNALGGTNQSWWGIPFFMTFVALVVIELIVSGFLIDTWLRKNAS